jgi:hypothetical protein
MGPVLGHQFVSQRLDMVYFQSIKVVQGTPFASKSVVAHCSLFSCFDCIRVAFDKLSNSLHFALKSS